MSKLSVFLIPRKIIATLGDMGVQNMNFPLNQSDFKIYKQLTNSIDIYIKNVDRKSVNSIGKNVSIIITEYNSNTLLLKKSLQLIDASKGFYKLILTPTETQNWNTGFTSYSLLLKDEEDIERPLYIDHNQRIKGYFEFLADSYPNPRESILIKGGDPTAEDYSGDFVPQEYNEFNEVYYVTGAYAGNQQTYNLTGIQTFVIYTTDFTGKLWVEGNLDNSPSTENEDWFNIPLNGNEYKQYQDSTGNDSYTIEMNLQWIRFKYFPDPLNTGTLDKVLFRN